MSNISTPSGSPGPTTPGRSTEPVKPGTDRFKDLMKVGESDEQQKKRKKRSQESVEEEKAKLAGGTPVVQEHPSPLVAPLPSSQKQASGTKGPKEFMIGTSEQPEPLLSVPHHAPVLSQETTPRAPSQELPEPTPPEVAAAPLIAPPQEKPEAPQPYRKTDRTEETPVIAMPPLVSPLGPPLLPPATAAPPLYTTLHSEALALFERMVSAIIVVASSRATETTIHLDPGLIEHSPFAGAQLVIREYSTAPLSYNVELIGNPLAVQTFRKYAPVMKQAFDEGKYRFRVNRLDSSLLKE